MPAAGHFAGGSGGGCARSRYDGADIPGLAAFQHAPMAAGPEWNMRILHSLAQAAPSLNCNPLASDSDCCAIRGSLIHLIPTNRNGLGGIRGSLK